MFGLLTSVATLGGFVAAVDAVAFVINMLLVLCRHSSNSLLTVIFVRGQGVTAGER